VTKDPVRGEFKRERNVIRDSCDIRPNASKVDEGTRIRTPIFRSPRIVDAFYGADPERGGLPLQEDISYDAVLFASHLRAYAETLGCLCQRIRKPRGRRRSFGRICLKYAEFGNCPAHRERRRGIGAQRFGCSEERLAVGYAPEEAKLGRGKSGMVRIACIGGFLGAGKTTALVEAARNLIARGVRVGVITNDQGRHLVDTALVRSLGLQTEEITGGCFCCRFTEFVKHASRVVDQLRPDIILAEAVGSCTDLAATVYEPLRRFHVAEFEPAPLSVFVEPLRIQELLGHSSQFEDSVRYLFEKQLAEAELIILSKSDMLNQAEIKNFTEELGQLAGEIPVSVMSARTGFGVNEWVDQLLRVRSVGNTDLDLDYEIYGQAETSLGWLNATVDLASDRDFRPAELGEAVVVNIQEQCRATKSAIAHLKLLLVTAEGSGRIALTTSSGQAAWDGEGSLGLVREASAIINARVGTNPGKLRRMVEDALQSAAREQGVSATVLDMESFAPLPPKRPVLQSAN